MAKAYFESMLRTMSEMLKVAFAALVGAMSVACAPKAKALTPGDAAPEFSLAGSDGKNHTLSDLRGHYVVVAWFPKAFTGG